MLVSVAEQVSQNNALSLAALVSYPAQHRHIAQETRMTTAAAARPTIALWMPLHRRAAALLLRAAHALYDGLMRSRQAAAERALQQVLDARTLRDIGLGDWAVVPPADNLRARWDDTTAHRF
jgi:hypothetical protein